MLKADPSPRAGDQPPHDRRTSNCPLQIPSSTLLIETIYLGVSLIGRGSTFPGLGRTRRIARPRSVERFRRIPQVAARYSGFEDPGMTRNPHAAEPFSNDDEEIVAALQDVSVPALLCSLVHMTGDPAWIRGDIRPRVAVSLDIQSGIPADERAQVRRTGSAGNPRYCDGGCLPRGAGRARAPAGNDVVFRLAGL